MCGIFCLFNRQGFGFNSKETIDKYIENGKLLAHRGEKHNYRIINQKLFLFHNRLSINDLSEKGSQPMTNKQIMIVVNGEIYNYSELYDIIKKDLPTYKFKSTSDSEILIPMYLLYGSAFIRQIRGMFSFVLYDMKKNIVLAARDHIGITSLYYAEDKETDTIMFASEMKSLVGLSDNVKTFEPGNIFINRSFFNYYNPEWKNTEIIPTSEVVYDEIKQKLINSVLKHTISDQPIGILLSGGLDSSLIASIMCHLKKNKLINNPIKTFTIGLEDAVDIVAAEKVADFLESYHSTYNFGVEDAIDVLETVIYHLETFNITTIRASIPLYLLSMQIKEDSDIKVLLSGEIADELFGGYLYFHKAPDREEMQYELVDKINALHKYDLLRAHKISLANTIELRVPFGDKDYIDYIMNIDPKYKMIDKQGEYNIEKYILRKAFDNGKFLPDEILWRKKEQFSDGISSEKENLIDKLKNYAEKEITDMEFDKRAELFPVNTPLTKEAFLYRQIFEKFYKKDCCIKTVDENTNKSISCSTERGLKWLGISELDSKNDASGRSMDLYI
jgi:asparagine synthase (glutamine-hydrolysing)